MSADTTPISPTRFAAALKDLPLDALHLKVLEIRNAIAHLQYSNDQLKPFAEGTATPLTPSPSPATTAGNGDTAPDQDCIDAIRENEAVIDRMAERIAVIRIEVEDRGVSWAEFQSKDELATAAAAAAEQQDDDDDDEIPPAAAQGAQRQQTNGHPAPARGGGDDAQRSPWTDGTFQTGTISRNGEVRLDRQAGRPEGGSLSDEELRRALEERMRDLSHDDDEEGGMHL
ncbi:hypothetical protein ACO1O0_001130 [Amphichorda felina]